MKGNFVHVTSESIFNRFLNPVAFGIKPALGIKPGSSGLQNLKPSININSIPSKDISPSLNMNMFDKNAIPIQLDEADPFDIMYPTLMPLYNFIGSKKLFKNKGKL